MLLSIERFFEQREIRFSVILFCVKAKRLLQNSRRRIHRVTNFNFNFIANKVVPIMAMHVGE